MNLFVKLGLLRPRPTAPIPAPKRPRRAESPLPTWRHAIPGPVPTDGRVCESSVTGTVAGRTKSEARAAIKALRGSRDRLPVGTRLERIG